MTIHGWYDITAYWFGLLTMPTAIVLAIFALARRGAGVRTGTITGAPAVGLAIMENGRVILLLWRRTVSLGGAA